MKITKNIRNGEADIILKALSEYANSDNERPVAVGLKIVRSIKGLVGALEPYSVERERIVKKYAGEDGSVNKEEAPEKFEKCKAKIEELMNATTDVEIDTLTAEEMKTMSAPMKHMIGFEFLLEEGE